MLDGIVLTEKVLMGGAIAVLVFGGVRFADDLVDLAVALEGSAVAMPPEEADSPNP